MSQSIYRKIRNFLIAEDGPTIVEYAVMLALIVGMMMAAIIYVGNQAGGIANDAATGTHTALTSK
jgi:pilus assembly protein Flp/PilA